MNLRKNEIHFLSLHFLQPLKLTGISLSQRLLKQNFVAFLSTCIVDKLQNMEQKNK